MQGPLDASAAYLKANPDQLVLIEGHCDERGTIEYNLALGERRAKASMNYLVAQGIDASRFTLISYGKERPVAPRRTGLLGQESVRPVLEQAAVVPAVGEGPTGALSTGPFTGSSQHASGSGPSKR